MRATSALSVASRSSSPMPHLQLLPYGPPRTLIVRAGPNTGYHIPGFIPAHPDRQLAPALPVVVLRDGGDTGGVIPGTASTGTTVRIDAAPGAGVVSHGQPPVRLSRGTPPPQHTQAGSRCRHDGGGGSATSARNPRRTR